jgi:hypothetical protein
MLVRLQTAGQVVWMFANSVWARVWLYRTHLSKLNGQNIPAYRSFVLEGPRECPTRIRLYATDAPRVTDAAVWTFPDSVCASA